MKRTKKFITIIMLVSILSGFFSPLYVNALTSGDVYNYITNTKTNYQSVKQKIEASKNEEKYNRSIESILYFVLYFILVISVVSCHPLKDKGERIHYDNRTNQYYGDHHPLSLLRDRHRRYDRPAEQEERRGLLSGRPGHGPSGHRYERGGLRYEFLAADGPAWPCISQRCG